MSSIWYLSNAPKDGIFSTPSNGAFLEFNRDIFLCNQIDQSPIITNNNPQYPTSSLDPICKTQNITIDTNCQSLLNSKDNNVLPLKQCEICKNFQYRDWYDLNQSSLRAFSDVREEYLRAWLQSWNLGIGILFVLYGIYYQQS